MNLVQICEQVKGIAIETGNYLENESKNFQRDRATFKNNFKDLVSYVDKESEKKIISGLGEILPKAGFIAEESLSGKMPLEEFFWIIDPLDGTTNFIHGLPIFSISIALANKNDVLVGVVYEVGKRECFSAIKGGGAFLGDSRIYVSDQQDIKNTLSVTGFPYYDFDGFDSYMKAIKHFLRETHGVRRLGSAAVDLSYVAAGRFDSFFEIGLNSWDVAAGSLLVEEAGGIVSDFKGKKDYLFGKEIFAANKLHPELLQMFNDHWGPT